LRPLSSVFRDQAKQRECLDEITGARFLLKQTVFINVYTHAVTPLNFVNNLKAILQTQT
jgi:hypothetical protein